MTEQKFNVDLAREINGSIKFGQIKTRDGRPARIICWNALGSYPIVALINMGGYEFPSNYTNDGKNDCRDNVMTNLDLVIETEGGEQ